MRTDVLIIGCGIGGATAALRLAADRERHVTVVTREAEPEESNSSWAQGGIVALGLDDSTDALVDDVLEAGAGLSFPPAVRLLAEDGPRLVREVLIDEAGTEFEHGTDGGLEFGLEGGHSRRRIAHVGDATGRAIMGALLRQLAVHPNVELLSGQTAVDLITFPHHSPDPQRVYETPACHGAYLLDQATGAVRPALASHTVLATGGLGQIFLNTSNPAGARGDGLAMAYRAGVRVGNCEYVQFHPTTLHMPGTTKFLISEAVRGEGGRLLTPEGEPFMRRYAPEWLDLAPRDVAARAIYAEMLAHGWPHVLLDIASHKPAAWIRRRFRQICETCKRHGFDLAEQPVPVVPAAHYFCGGVLVDLWGRTSMPGLYAVAEVSCTGVHGANRLASTSLLEGLVWGDRAARDIRGQRHARPLAEDDVPPWDMSGSKFDPDPALIQGDMQNVRNLMWHYVGLVRAEYRINRAIRELTHLLLNIEDFYRKARLTDGLIGLRNAVLAALVVARAAHSNHTSRGCHWREDSRGPVGGSTTTGNSHLDPGVGSR